LDVDPGVYNAWQRHCGNCASRSGRRDNEVNSLVSSAVPTLPPSLHSILKWISACHSQDPDDYPPWDLAAERQAVRRPAPIREIELALAE
jgi:hypothetical protein